MYVLTGPRSPAPPMWIRPDQSPCRAAATPDFHGASRGYEGVIAAALVEAGLPIAIVNPRQVRKFADAIGRLAKTDAIDAGVIAPFADAIRPVPKPKRRLRWKCRRVAVLETKCGRSASPLRREEARRNS
jgi:transposase